MKEVRQIESTMAPLDRADVDTDQIIPKQFMKRIERTGFGPFAFYDWAHTAAGELSSDFILNRPDYASARILVTGQNFGCGSSREHAPWALQDRGFDAIIAPSFADIFRNNCAKIGLLCVVLEPSEVAELMELAKSDPGAVVRVDLERKIVEAGDVSFAFSFDEFSRECLLNGWDEIALTERREQEIGAFEASRKAWLSGA